MMACAFLWSLAGLFIKILDWNPFLIAGMRSLIAFFFLLMIVRTVRLAWSWPLVGAALANAATMLLFVAANKTTTAANAIILQYLAPAFTAILGVIILKENIRREQLIALILTPVGMALLFLDRLATVFVGVYHEEQIKALLGIPDNIKIVGLFPLGYPAGEAKGGPLRKQLSDFVHYGKW